ncbi:MAG TPA: hypothetical protein VER58_22315 [Thermoanaerobaculia bacterium]|nr:hypothetical protein [Thermoanaerobaculia bacterium]
MKHFAAVALLSLAAVTFAANSPKPTLTCSLTGKNMAKCCCKKTSDGRLYCKLAKKTIESCCCKPIKSEHQ